MNQYQQNLLQQGGGTGQLPPLAGATPMQVNCPQNQQGESVQQLQQPQFVHQANRRKKKVAKLSNRGTPRVTKNEQTMAHIKHAVKDTVFRIVKFMTTDQEQLTFVKMVFNAIAFAEPYPGGFEEFHRVYQSYCLHELNDHRNYIVAQTRKEVFSYMNAHDGDEPLFSKIEAIVMRTASSEPEEEDKKLAVWYVGKLLTRVTGTIDWCKPRYYYEHISDSHFPDKPNKKHVPPSTEALVLLICDGHIPVWKAQWDYRKEHGEDTPYPNVRVKPAPDEVDKFANFRNKHTEPAGGGDKFGGWTKEAITLFAKFKADITAARAKETNSDFEEMLMVGLREKHKVPHSTIQAYEAAQNTPRSKDPKPQEVIEGVFGDEE